MRNQEDTSGMSTAKPFSSHYPSHSSTVSRQPAVVRAAPPGSTPYASKEFTEQFIRQSSVENSLSASAQITSTSNGNSNRETSESKARGMSSGKLEILDEIQELTKFNGKSFMIL